MNLIEQLGGHEKAKQILISCEFHGRKDLRVPVAGGFIHIVVDFLEKDLLDYRKEHNIFEVGDKVVWKESLSIISSLMEIESIDGDTWGIRHATNEEIKAGRRLSKIKCWSCDKEMSHSDRAENDGFCIHCNAEIEL